MVSAMIDVCLNLLNVCESIYLCMLQRGNPILSIRQIIFYKCERPYG